jgi:two-component system, NarL family, response regulator DevR
VSSSLRITVVNSQVLVGRGFRDLFRDHPGLEMVAEAHSIAEGVGLTTKGLDLVIIANQLPDGSGFELARQLLAARPKLNVVLLVSRLDDRALSSAVDTGLRGLLLKSMNEIDLVNSITRAARGSSLVSKEQRERASIRQLRHLDNDVRVESLSPQESKILSLIGEGMSNKEIAAEMFLAEKTVKNYITKMLAKLGFTRRTEAALFAYSRYMSMRELD